MRLTASFVRKRRTAGEQVHVPRETRTPGSGAHCSSGRSRAETTGPWSFSLRGPDRRLYLAAEGTPSPDRVGELSVWVLMSPPPLASGLHTAGSVSPSRGETGELPSGFTNLSMKKCNVMEYLGYSFFFCFFFYKYLLLWMYEWFWPLNAKCLLLFNVFEFPHHTCVSCRLPDFTEILPLPAGLTLWFQASFKKLSSFTGPGWIWKTAFWCQTAHTLFCMVEVKHPSEVTIGKTHFARFFLQGAVMQVSQFLQSRC